MIAPSRYRVWRRLLAMISVAMSFASCSALPAFGPSSAAVEQAAVSVVSDPNDVLPFQIVDVSSSTIPARQTTGRSFPLAMRQRGLGSSDSVIEIADELEIRIWEIADDGLFATAGRRETVLPVVVSNSGTITAPYADTVVAKGLTAAELRTVLLESYRGQAIEPEITVSVKSTQSTTVTVLGAVRSPGRTTVPARGMRLLDVLAQTGGTPHVPWEANIAIQRGSTTTSLFWADIIGQTHNNIVMFPGDTINVTHIPRRFAVYGAVNRPGNIEVPLEHATLSYVLAEVGGLNDGIAKAKSVFVFRPSAMATAFRFDFSQPDAFLLAGQFQLQATDTIYVTAAEVVDLQRVLSTVLSPVLGSAAAANDIGS